MSTCGVEHCGRPVGDAYVCTGCGTLLEADLADVPSLAGDLDAKLARLMANGDRNGGRSSVTPLPYDPAASEAGWILRNTLSGWVRELRSDAVEHHGPTCRGNCRHRSCTQLRSERWPADTMADMGRWLLLQVERIRHHAAAGEAVDEIRSAVDQVRRTLDRPGVYRLLPCPSAEPCGGKIRVTIDTICARCDTCEWQTDDLHWLGRMLRDDEPDHVTAVDACHRLMSIGVAIVPATLRKWVQRGKLASLGRDHLGRNLYDLATVEALATREREAVA